MNSGSIQQYHWKIFITLFNHDETKNEPICT
jgi:hypothetical protein